MPRAIMRLAKAWRMSWKVTFSIPAKRAAGSKPRWLTLRCPSGVPCFEAKTGSSPPEYADDRPALPNATRQLGQVALDRRGAVDIEVFGGLGGRFHAPAVDLAADALPRGRLAATCQFSTKLRVGGSGRGRKTRGPVIPTAALDARNGHCDVRLSLNQDRSIEDPVLLCAHELLAFVEEDVRVERVRDEERADRAGFTDLGDRETAGCGLVQADVFKLRFGGREERDEGKAAERGRLAEAKGDRCGGCGGCHAC